MNPARQLLGVLLVWVMGAVLVLFGIPFAVHLAAVITPTGVTDYPWWTPALLARWVQGTPFPSSTMPCMVAVLIILIVLLGVLSVAGLGLHANGRASILRLRFYVWWKSRPRRAPLTAKTSEPLGRIGWFGFFGIRWFTDMLEDGRMLLAPSGAGKTVRVVVQLILRAVGAVVSTSTKPDVLRLTAWVRHTRFPDATVMAFDPENLLPWLHGVSWLHRVKWNIVAGCEDGQMAMKRAAAIVAARPLNGSESSNSGFFNTAVTIVLQCMLHAAAIKGLSMRDVMKWMGDFDDDTPYNILRHEPAAIHAWEALLTKYCRGKADETVSSTDMSASGILNAFSIESILETVCPRVGDSVLDTRTLHRSNDTLYLICKGEDSPAASVFTALVESLVVSASDDATRTGPINPPLELVLDEAMNVCPIPSLSRLMSTARGEGIVPSVVVQDYPQIVERYGQSKAKTIVNNATELLVMGGLKDPDYLQDLSTLAGTLTRGGGRSDQVMAPERIRTLRDGKALFFYRNLPPAVITLPPWWRSRHKAEYQASLDWATAAQNDHRTAAGAAATPMKELT